METAIRWSPSSSAASPRFLFADVVNRSFNLGTLTSYHAGRTPNITYSYSPTYSCTPAFRALDWAPNNEKLLAVGTPSGETVVLRLDNGDVTPATFVAKYPRPCNAVAFSKEGKVASGLERARNDHSLILWDIHSHVEGQDIDLRGARQKPSFVEPLRKFASGEAVSSIKFFGSQPDVLVVGVKGVGIRCYDIRDGATNPNLQFETLCAHNIAIDPLNEVHFACAGPTGDTTIQIWDVRFGLGSRSSAAAAAHNVGVTTSRDRDDSLGPILSYPDVFDRSKYRDAKVTAANIWSLRYCKGKSGLLGALASNGDFRGVETRKMFVHAPPDRDGVQDGDSGLQNRDVISPYLTRQVHHLRNSSPEEGRTEETPRVVSFDFTNLAGSRGEPTAILLHSDRSVSLMEVQTHAPCMDLSSQGALAWSKRDRKTDSNVVIGASSTISDINVLSNRLANADLASKKATWGQIRQKESKSGKQEVEVQRDAASSSFERYQAMYGLSTSSPKLNAAEALCLANIAKDRCASGYGLNSERNIEIVGEDPWLKHLWQWIDRAKHHAAEDDSNQDKCDLNYLGIFGLWTEDLGSETESRSTRNEQCVVRDTIKSRARFLKLPNQISCKTDYLEHRQLCLRTLGLALREQELADNVIRLARGGEQTKGAALALMMGHHNLALMALKTGKLDANHRALALSVAAYANGTSADSWSDVVQSILEDVTDPYARTILSLVKHGNWRDVLKQSSLPLRERVGVAVLHLPDTELTGFVRQYTIEVIKKGDLEGIVLTGLTEKAVPLLQVYAEAFSDLQSATLALCHSSPRYFRDTIVDAWRQVYRSWMNRWSLFIQRAQFDVASSQLAGESKSVIGSSPPQYSVRCTYCETRVDRSASDVVAQNDDDAKKSSFGTHHGSIFGGIHTGTSCLECGRRMPRCVICLHWLGTLDATSKYGIKEAEKLSRKQAFGQMTSFCRRCRHMFHVHHAESWFSKHSACPQPDCDCHCREAQEDVYGSSPER